MLFEAALKIIGFSDVKPSGLSFRLENVNAVHDIRPAYARWAPARHLAKAFDYRRRRRLASPQGLAAPPNRGRRCALAAEPRPFFGPDPGLRRTQGPLRGNGRHLRRRFSSPGGTPPGIDSARTSLRPAPQDVVFGRRDRRHFLSTSQIARPSHVLQIQSTRRFSTVCIWPYEWMPRHYAV
jgi:hypothetical protein